MLSVSQERDRVILDLHGRRRDVLLPCDVALRLAEALETAADLAEREPPTLIRGERWGCQVESAYGQVCLRFTPPDLGNPERVPLTAAAARKLADVIRFKEEQAEHRLRLNFKARR